MANPAVRTLTEKTVTKIANNVKSGTIQKHWFKGRDMTYIVTTRQTGDTAPTAKQVTDEGKIMFCDCEQEEIISSEYIDVYVYCNNGNSDTTDIGKLVVIL